MELKRFVVLSVVFNIYLNRRNTGYKSFLDCILHVCNFDVLAILDLSRHVADDLSDVQQLIRIGEKNRL
jgi:hypothetical protein